MRKFKSQFGEVDLDSPKTYKHLPKTLNELDNMMFKEIGQALCYMDYFPSRKGLFPTKKRKQKLVGHPYSNRKVDVANVGYNQRQRVYKLINNFCKDRKNNFKNLIWFKEQIFLFQDETENMC